MIDRELIERASKRFDPPPDAFERFTRRHNRRRRNRRIATGALAVIIAATAIGGLVRTFSAGPERPASDTITPKNLQRLRLLQTIPLGENAKGLGIAGNFVIVNGDRSGGSVQAFPTSCGGADALCAPAWTSDIAGPVVTAGAHVFVAGRDELPPSCGAGGPCDPVLFARVPGETFGYPTTSAGVLYVATTTRQLLGFPVDCARLPCAPVFVSEVLSDRPGGTAALVGGRLVVGTGAPGRAAPGHVYEFPTRCPSPCAPTRVVPPLAPHGAQIATVGNLILVGTAINAFHGQLIAYPAACFLELACRPAWTATMPGALNAPRLVVAGGVVLVASPFGADFVAAFPLRCSDSCQPLWTASDVPRIAPGPLAFTGGVLFVASQTSGLRAFPSACGSGSAACRPAWTWGTGSDGPEVGVRFVVVATSDRVFAVTTDGQLLVFGLQ